MLTRYVRSPEAIFESAIWSSLCTHGKEFSTCPCFVHHLFYLRFLLTLCRYVIVYTDNGLENPFWINHRDTVLVENTNTGREFNFNLPETPFLFLEHLFEPFALLVEDLEIFCTHTDEAVPGKDPSGRYRHHSP